MLNVSSRERTQLTRELDSALKQGEAATRQFYQKWYHMITVDKHLKWGWMRHRIIDTAQEYYCKGNSDVFYTPPGSPSHSDNENEDNNITRQIFSRKLVNTLNIHLTFIRRCQLNDTLHIGSNKESFFSIASIEAAIKASINKQYIEYMQRFNSNLMIQDIGKADIIKLRNAFRNYNETELHELADMIYNEHSDAINILSHKDKSHTHLCRGLALRIIDYIRHQDDPCSEELVQLAKEGVSQGHSETFDNLHLSVENSNCPTTIRRMFS